MSNSNAKSVKLNGRLRGARSDSDGFQSGDSEEEKAEKKRLGEMRKSLSRYEMELNRREKEIEKKESELDRRLKRLADLLSSVKEEKQELLEASEEEIVSFSLTIVDKVLQSEIENGRYKIDQIIKSTLRKVKTQNGMVVRVNPQDHELAQASVEKLGETYGATNMRVVPDESISLASCCIETDSGKIYSEIPGRLQRIKETLLTEGEEGMQNEQGKETDE